MAEESLKQKAVQGVMWNGLDQFSSIGLRFVIGVILARLLSPAEYGVIGLVTVFLTVSDVFIHAGFASALIRKINRTENDKATVFYFNIVVSVIMYALLFCCAPVIARFFELDELKDITRVLAITLVINSLGEVHDVLLTTKLDFKTKTKVSVFSVLIGGGFGILLAYSGLGVWALVGQALSVSLIRTILLWIFSRWRPCASFSWESFRELFSYGSRLLISGLIDTLYNNLYNVVIGKLFTPVKLGLYSRAYQFAMLPSSTLNSVVQKVSFPVLSTLQEDIERLQFNYRRILRMTTFVTFPCTMLLFGVADPLIRFMLTDKWAGCILLLQIVCFQLVLIPVHSINLNLLKVKGRSDLFLRLEVIKKAIGITILIITYRWGLEAMCCGGVASSVIFLFINTYYTGKLIDVGFMKQMGDVLPMLLFSIVAGVISNLFSCVLQMDNIWRFALASVVYAVVYLGQSYIFYPGVIKEAIALIQRKG